MTGELDCIVVGSGPGGYIAAIRSAQLGMRTAVIEREPQPGGRCLHSACIPAKTVLRSADIVSEIRVAERYGIDVGPPVVSFSTIAQRRGEVIATLASGVKGLLAKNNVELITAEATLDVNRTVHVADRTLRPSVALILATGSVARNPPGIVSQGRVIGTEEAWAFDHLPTSVAVLGAGASGAEIASGFARLGSHVRLLEYAERILPGEDPDISTIVDAGFRAQDIDVHTAALIEDVSDLKNKVEFRVGQDRFEADWLILATGRRPDSSALGLERSGVEFNDEGYIAVDSYQRTSIDGVYAIGDLVAGPALAHKASEEGIVAIETAAGNSVAPVDHANIPRATFCTPNVASVGLTEGEARAAGYDVAVGKASYSAVGAGAVYGDRQGLVKIVGDRKYGAILGAHIVGSRATELIQQFVDVKHLEGGYPELARIIHGHPTLSESLLEAARAADGWIIHG
jgi:dihydrolipoamide dehydrogenase